jgi:hypothetical protein
MADKPDEAEVCIRVLPSVGCSRTARLHRANTPRSTSLPSDLFARNPLTEAKGLFQFLKDVQDRADKMGWFDGILNITLEVTDDNEPVQEKLIENYGTILLEKVVESELQYINEQGPSTSKDERRRHIHALQSASWRP